jgi:enoyl-CoA hydratase
MAAHIRVASTNAMLGLPEVSLGVIPGYGGTQRLAQLVGKGKAMELILTAGMISAEEGLACGLVNKVVKQEELMEEVLGMAKKIKRNAPTALAAAIKSILAGYTDSVDGHQVEINEFGKCFATEDFREGTTAFIEKRRAKFPGK